MTPTQDPPSLSLPRPDWLVLANASRARVFERDTPSGVLREIADPVHLASRERDAASSHDRPGRAHKGSGSTPFEPRTAPHLRERGHFAQELADLLESAALERRVHALVLMASNPFLGDLKAALGPSAQAVLRSAIALDLTGFQGRELEQRVNHALTEHSPAADSDRR